MMKVLEIGISGIFIIFLVFLSRELGWFSFDVVAFAVIASMSIRRVRLQAYYQRSFATSMDNICYICTSVGTCQFTAHVSTIMVSLKLSRSEQLIDFTIPIHSLCRNCYTAGCCTLKITDVQRTYRLYIITLAVCTQRKFCYQPLDLW